MSSKCQRVQLCEDEQSYFQLMEDTKFEKFWDVIQDYSFPAFFVPLSPETAQLLIDAHAQFVRSQDSGCPFSLSDHSGLLELCRAINSGARDRGWIHDTAGCEAAAGIFVRLSTRSPKDSVMFRPSLAAELRSEYCILRQAEETDASTTVASTALHALYRISVAANRCASAEMCMQLLAESKRIQGDLEHYVAECLRHPAPAPVFNFIVRPFVPFDVENEFRAFVFQRRLTAITQYNELCYFPRLQHCHEDVCRVMTHTTEALIAQLPSTLHNCVIDFVCIREANGWSARVVEINPMAEFAGCGLFSFEKDWRVLQGHDAFQFRFQKDASHVALAMKQMSSDCKAVIRNADIPELRL
jgi:hypothetical protein